MFRVVGSGFRLSNPEPAPTKPDSRGLRLWGFVLLGPIGENIKYPKGLPSRAS